MNIQLKVALRGPKFNGIVCKGKGSDKHKPKPTPAPKPSSNDWIDDHSTYGTAF